MQLYTTDIIEWQCWEHSNTRIHLPQTCVCVRKYVGISLVVSPYPPFDVDNVVSVLLSASLLVVTFQVKSLLSIDLARSWDAEAEPASYIALN